MLGEGAAVIGTHRPHVAWRKGCHRCQNIVDESRVRTAHYRQGLQLPEEAALTPAVASTMVMELANRTHIMTRFLLEREKTMLYPSFFCGAESSLIPAVPARYASNR